MAPSRLWRSRTQSRTESRMLRSSRTWPRRCSGVPPSPNMRSNTTRGFTSIGSGVVGVRHEIVFAVDAAVAVVAGADQYRSIRAPSRSRASRVSFADSFAPQSGRSVIAALHVLALGALGVHAGRANCPAARMIPVAVADARHASGVSPLTTTSVIAKRLQRRQKSARIRSGALPLSASTALIDGAVGTRYPRRRHAPGPASRPARSSPAPSPRAPAARQRRQHPAGTFAAATMIFVMNMTLSRCSAGL